MTNPSTEDLFRRLIEGAAEGKAIAAARPSWDQLAEALFLLRSSSGLIAGDLTNIREVAVRLPDPAPESPFRRDAETLLDAHLNARNELVLETATLVGTGMLDHLSGLGLLVAAEAPPRSMLALARVVLSAAAQLCYVIDPSLTARQRSARAANFRISMLREELQDALREDKEESQVAALTDDIEELLRAGELDGYAMKGKTRVKQCFDPPQPPEAQLIHDAVDARGQFRNLSSVIHVQERTHVQFVLGLGASPQEVHGRSYAAMHMGASLIATAEAIQAAATYFGYQPIQPIIDASLNCWAAGAGLMDEELRRRIRESGGGPITVDWPNGTEG